MKDNQLKGEDNSQRDSAQYKPSAFDKLVIFLLFQDCPHLLLSVSMRNEGLI